MKSDLAIGRDLFPVLRETHKLKQFRFADLMIICYCFMDQSAQMTLTSLDKGTQPFVVCDG